MSTTYFIVPAPGHYGDRARVASGHKSLLSARKKLRPGFVVRVGSKRKGDEWLRVYEQMYPLAD